MHLKKRKLILLIVEYIPNQPPGESLELHLIMSPLGSLFSILKLGKIYLKIVGT